MTDISLTKHYDYVMTNLEANQHSEASYLPQFGYIIVIGMNGRPDEHRKCQFKVELNEVESQYGLRTALIDARIAAEGDRADYDKANNATIRLERNGQDVIVPFVRTKDAKMYQLGRSSSKAIDFFVDAPRPYQIPIVSRFACRILVEKRDDEAIARIYAAAFDDDEKIFIGEHACTLIERLDGCLDSFTSNGVLVLRPKACPGDDAGLAWTKHWREVSIFGRLFKIRESRNRPTRVDEAIDEENTLLDGTIIDLGGVQLLWRHKPPAVDEAWLRAAFSSTKDRKLVSCAGSKPTLIFNEKNCHPCVYTGCGHVVTATKDGTGAPQIDNLCAVSTCKKPGQLISLQESLEPFVFVDDGKLDCCFIPCGHLVNENTAKLWSSIAFRTATDGVTICPFCAKHLDSKQNSKWIKLIITEVPLEMSDTNMSSY